jgi:hypothetical protein
MICGEAAALSTRDFPIYSHQSRVCLGFQEKNDRF